MKRKEVIYLILALAFLIGAVIVAYSVLGPKKAPRQAVVEVIVPIKSDFNNDALGALTDPTKTKDFSVPVDLTTGIGNSKLFGP